MQKFQGGLEKLDLWFNLNPRSVTRPSSIKPSIFRIAGDTPRVNRFHFSSETGVKGIFFVMWTASWFGSV